MNLACEWLCGLSCGYEFLRATFAFLFNTAISEKHFLKTRDSCGDIDLFLVHPYPKGVVLGVPGLLG